MKTFLLLTLLVIFTFGYAQTEPPARNPLGSLLPLILIILVIYFLMFLPQQRRQKRHQAMISQIKKGDRVVTTTGIHGVISEVKETTFIIKIDENTKMEIEKGAIAYRKQG